MASLLAGARLVLSQGARFFPAYRVRPAAGTVRCLSSSARFLTAAVQDRGAVNTEPLEPRTHYQSRFDGWSMHSVGVNLKKDGRISKHTFLNVFDSLCEKGTLSDSQASFLLYICESSLPGVPIAEQTEIANKVWKKIQDMGVACTVDHYNTLLKIYIDNENKFSPTDFLAGMEAAGVQPNQITYERLIAVYCNEGNIEGASNVLGFLKSHNLPITEGIFSYLVRGHARAGDMESAKNMLSVMQEAGLAPGGSTYTELLVAYAEKNDVENFKQILGNCKPLMVESVCQSVIYSLAKAGHSQFLPDVFEHMPTPIVQHREFVNLCVKLLAQGCGDVALELAKRFIPVRHSDDFISQQGSFFIRQCVDLNMPVDTMKKYFSELKDSNLHRSPLQFALMCALEDDNQGLALDLMKAMQEKKLPLEPHYFWPMLASCRRKDDVKGCFQVLKLMHKMKVYLDLGTFQNYFIDLFPNGEYPESLLQDKKLQKQFNDIYLSTLSSGIKKGDFKRVYMLLSLGVPLVVDGNLNRLFQKMFFKSHDVEILAKITKLLCQDHSSLKNSSAETDPVGYFLCGLIVSMSELGVLGKEGHLKQYFHQLKEMGITLGAVKAGRMYYLLRSANLSGLIEDVKALVPAYDMDKRISELEEQVENRKVNGEPINALLIELLYNLIEKENLEKAMELTLKYPSDFNLGMYLKVLGLCCRSNDPVQALKIKEELSRRDFPGLRKLKYMELVKVLALNDHVEDAINILKEMQERNVTVDQESNKAFVNILNSLAKKGDVDSVNRLHEHLVMLGLAKPTNKLCEPLVQVHIVREDLSAALDAMIDCNKKYKFFQAHPLLLKLVNNEETDLLKKAVDYIYNTSGERVMLHHLLFSFLESGNYTEARKIAETPGLRAIPGMIKWFAYRLRYHNKEDCLEQCLEITRNLFGVDRTDVYYELLVLYDKNNKWEKAIELWHNMKENGVAIQEKFSYLFRQLFARSGQDILTHIPEFEQQYEEIDNFSTKVLNLCKDSKYIEALNIILMTAQTDKPLNRSVYAHLIKGLLEAGQLDDALRVEAIARRYYRNYSIKKVSYNLLLQEQVRQDCLKEALVTLKSMLSNDSLPSRFILTSMSQAFALKGDLASLDEMEELTNSNNLILSKFDGQYFICRILAHFVNGNFDEGTSMIESKCTQDPDSLKGALLLTILMRNNMSEALEKVSIVAERLGNQFSSYKLATNLFLLYVQHNKLEDAKQLIQRCNGILEQSQLLKRNITRNAITGQSKYIDQLVTLLDEYDPSYKEHGYNALLKQKVFKHNLDGALRMYEKMKAEDVEPDAKHLKKLAVLLRMDDRPVPFPEPLDSVEYSSDESDESDASSPEDEH